MFCRELRGLAAALPPSLDAAHIARVAGLSVPLHELRGELDPNAYVRVWRAIMAESRDPSAPFRIGLGIPFGTYEVVDYLASSCPTVGVGLEKLARYFRIITPYLSWECDALAEPPAVTLRARHASPEEQLVFVQYTLGVTFGRFRELAEHPVEFVHVDLAIPPPPSPDAHEAFFRCPIRYGAERSRCVLTRATWNAPLSRREAGLREVLERHAAELLSRCREQGDELSEVRMAIHELLPDGPPKLEVVAKAVATSARTLQRRLRDTGTSFQELVEEERRSAARAYLSDARLAVGEVAYLLGYSEASAFVRAFKRWTGATPRQYRQHLT